MNPTVIWIIQSGIIISAIVFVHFALRRISKPRYKDEDSSILFNVTLSITGLSAIVGGILLVATMFVGFEKNTILLLYNIDGNWKAPIIGWGGIAVFLVYLRFFILKYIQSIKLASHREGMVEAMKIYYENIETNNDTTK